MPSRIIKRGSTNGGRIQAFSFTNFVEGPPAVTEDADWPEESPSQLPVPPAGSAEPVQREASVPAPDLAQIEKQAFESGFRQGERAGAEIAEKKMEAVMRRYAETVLELGRLKSVLYSQVEREVVKLAVEVAKKIVHREIHADPEIIQTLVRVALGHVAEKGAVTVHLHPVDYNYLLEHRGSLVPGTDGREIVLVADKSIERGGCMIQTECGDIDARIEEEFREVERSFFEGFSQ